MSLEAAEVGLYPSDLENGPVYDGGIGCRRRRGEAPEPTAEVGRVAGAGHAVRDAPRGRLAGCHGGESLAGLGLGRYDAVGSDIEALGADGRGVVLKSLAVQVLYPVRGVTTWWSGSRESRMLRQDSRGSQQPTCRAGRREDGGEGCERCCATM